MKRAKIKEKQNMKDFKFDTLIHKLVPAVY